MSDTIVNETSFEVEGREGGGQWLRYCWCAESQEAERCIKDIREAFPDHEFRLVKITEKREVLTNE